MTYLENRRVEIADEILGHDEVAIEFATEPLDAARQINVGANHGEIKSVTRSNVAIRHFAIVEREPCLQIPRRDRQVVA
jgi:hypothetical protein